MPIVGSHQSNTKNIAFQISNLFGGEIIETNNSNDQNYLNIDSFGNQWGWGKSGDTKDWSKIVINQANKEKIFCKQSSGITLWKNSESAKDINFSLEEYPKNLPVGRPNELIPAKHLTVNWGDFELLEITE